MKSEGYNLLKNKETAILCFWHGRMILFPRFITQFGGRYTAVVSAHGDGEVVSSIIKSYGYESLRGSSRKEAVQAMRGIIKSLKSGVSVCITPDGPIGPGFKVKGNLSNLAFKFKVPIIPLSFSARDAYEFKTWDRFLIPYPFTKILIDIGEPIRMSGPNDNFVEAKMIEQLEKIDTKLNRKIKRA